MWHFCRNVFFALIQPHDEGRKKLPYALHISIEVDYSTLLLSLAIWMWIRFEKTEIKCFQLARAWNFMSYDDDIEDKQKRVFKEDFKDYAKR